MFKAIDIEVSTLLVIGCTTVSSISCILSFAPIGGVGISLEGSRSIIVVLLLILLLFVEVEVFYWPFS